MQTAVGQRTILVSVIVPLYKDSIRLHRCLECLFSQSYPKKSTQIIVVDNDPTSDIEPRLSSLDVLLIHEPRPGSYAARNAGIVVASGDIIAFTDSDCCPCTDWLETGVRSLLNSPNAGFIAGKVSFFFRNEQPKGSVELFESTIGCPIPQELCMRNKRFGAAANLFVWRAIIDLVGPFNSHLKSAGDCEWGQRAAAAGYPGKYAAEVIVFHPSRSSWSKLWTHSARIAGGVYDLQRTRNLLSIRWVVTESLKDLALIGQPIHEFHGDGTLLPKWKRVFLWMPLSALQYVWSLPEVCCLSVWDRILVALAFIVYHYAQAAERVRMCVGGISRRA